MTLQELINNDIQLAELFENANDSEIIKRLNLVNLRGPVPINEISAIALESGLYGHCEAQIRKVLIEGNFPTGNEDIMRLAFDTLTLLRDYSRLQSADVDTTRFRTGLATYVALGWLTEENKNKIIALGENRISLAEKNLGRNINETDLHKLRNGE